MEEEGTASCTDTTATSNTEKSSNILVQDETASTTITKDSGYSTSCNSQSQKSGSFKSKSTNSSSSCESSRGGFHNSNINNIRQDNNLSGTSENINSPEKIKCTRRHKKKKKLSTSSLENLTNDPTKSTPMETNECDVSAETIIVENITEVNVTNENITVEETEMIETNVKIVNKITSSNKSVKTSTNKSSTYQEIQTNSPSNTTVQLNIEEKDIQPKAEPEVAVTSAKEFNAIVSMKDGVVLYCTANLTDVLGFPSDMWLGRSFIDFVHPNDRKTFASHVASCVTTPDEEIQQQSSSSTSFFPNFTKNCRNTKRNYLYCCLRHYNSLFKNGYGITDKRVHYKPCQLIFSFKEIPIEFSDSGMQKGMFLIINARTVNSIYKTPNEIMTNADKVFVRHNNACQVNFVNDDIVPYFGYLPHRIIGNSIFNFYHPEDIPYIKSIYQELLSNNSNNKFKIQNKKPIRIRCQNGNYCIVETDWSAFINPWTGQLEFIVGQHSVIQGPNQPDVCAILEVPEASNVHDDVMKQSKVVQEEINAMLNKSTLPHVKESTAKIKEPTKGLSSFMESLIENTIQPASGTQHSDKLDAQPTENVSERESVMLGEISPYHEYSDSKSSSETPPSYNQLNYDDNIQRFFESKPKTSPSDDSKSDETNKQSNKNKSDSSDLSGDNSGSGSNFQAPGTSASTRDPHQHHQQHQNPHQQQSMYHRQPLTEESLTKHNADMEKKMVQKHKEQKLSIKHKHKHNTHDDCNTHGVKRSGSHSWENEPFKSAKQSYNHHHSGDLNTRPNYSREGTTRTSMRHPNTSTNMNLWPPFNVSNTLINSNNMSTLLPYLYIPNTNESSKMPGPSNMAGAPITGIPYVSPFVYPLPLPLPMYSPILPMCSHLPLNHLPMQQQQQQQHLKTQQKPNPQHLSQQEAQRSVQKQINPSNPSLDNSFTGDESSYHSSLYSLLKTDESSPEEDNTKSQTRPQESQAKWKPTPQENIRLGLVRRYTNNEQVKYQLPERKLSDVLSQDLLALAQLSQPDMVNVQLSQLYSELELEGMSNKLKFEGTEKGFTSSSDGFESFANTSSDENSSSNQQQTSQKKVKKVLNYDKLSRLFEENAPIPPPNVIVSTTTTTTTTPENDSTVINATMVVIASC